MAKPYQILANLLVLSAIVYVGVDIFYRTVRVSFVQSAAQRVIVAAPVSQVDRPVVEKHNYVVITNRNIFGAQKVEEEEQEEQEEIPEVEVLAPTKLKLTLLGTIADGKGTGRVIIRDDSNKKQNIYRKGDAVQGAVIKNILRGKVVLRVNEHDEILTMQESKDFSSQKGNASHSAAGVKTAVKNIILEQAEIEKMMSNLSELLTQVKIRPYFRAGKTEGLIISRIGKNSVFAKLGLQNGDIIKTVDNNEIRSPDDALGLYENLKSGGQMTLKMIRRGKQQEINYDIR